MLLMYYIDIIFFQLKCIAYDMKPQFNAKLHFHRQKKEGKL